MKKIVKMCCICFSVAILDFDLRFKVDPIESSFQYMVRHFVLELIARFTQNEYNSWISRWFLRFHCECKCIAIYQNIRDVGQNDFPSNSFLFYTSSDILQTKTLCFMISMYNLCFMSAKLYSKSIFSLEFLNRTIRCNLFLKMNK